MKKSAQEMKLLRNKCVVVVSGGSGQGSQPPTPHAPSSSQKKNYCLLAICGWDAVWIRRRRLLVVFAGRSRPSKAAGTEPRGAE